MVDKELVMLPKAQFRKLLAKGSQLMAANIAVALAVIFVQMDLLLASAIAGISTCIILLFDKGRLALNLPRLAAAFLAAITSAILFAFW